MYHGKEMARNAATLRSKTGQELDNVCIIADTDPFAHGMVYVELSRVGSWNNVIF